MVGTPLEGFEVRVGDGAPGERGIIRLRGPAVMCGYLNPQRSAGEGIVDGWFETSDVGRLDSAGRLQVLGRADDMLVSGGELVPPAQVESLLLHCPGVRAVAVAGIPDPYWGEVTAAWVVGEWEPADTGRLVPRAPAGLSAAAPLVSGGCTARNRLGKARPAQAPRTGSLA